MTALWPAAFEPIRRDFGYDRAADDISALALARQLSDSKFQAPRVVERARVETRGKTIYIVGAADGAADKIRDLPPDAHLWTADGATSAALEAGRQPALIVTDLDGNIPDQVRAAKDGALVFVHAHGDNRAAVRDYVAKFPNGHVAGTCQVEAPEPLINPGGFTDGDRAVFLALYFGAARIRLIGFDFGKPGKFSGHPDRPNKPHKLVWAKKLIDDLIAAGAPVEYA